MCLSTLETCLSKLPPDRAHASLAMPVRYAPQVPQYAQEASQPLRGQRRAILRQPWSMAPHATPAWPRRPLPAQATPAVAPSLFDRWHLISRRWPWRWRMATAGDVQADDSDDDERERCEL